MSKSLRRVQRALTDAGIAADIREMPSETRTAQQAADAVGCDLDQILKSIIFATDDGGVVLFMTAGGNQVDPTKAAALAGGPLARADGAMVRATTGFAIGGVAPIGHIAPVRAFFDPKLAEFTEIWSAAGTPRHVFPANPGEIQRISGAQMADFTA